MKVYNPDPITRAEHAAPSQTKGFFKMPDPDFAGDALGGFEPLEVSDPNSPIWKGAEVQYSPHGNPPSQDQFRR